MPKRLVSRLLMCLKVPATGSASARILLLRNVVVLHFLACSIRHFMHLQTGQGVQRFVIHGDNVRGNVAADHSGLAWARVALVVTAFTVEG